MKKNNFTKEINNTHKKVQKNEPFSFKWILKIEVIIILILLLFVLSLNLISDKNKFEVKYNFERFFSQSVKKDNYNKKAKNFEQVISAVNTNKKLSNNEKYFINKVLEKEIKENIEFINLKKINKRLESLEIYYNSSNNTSNYNYRVSKNVAGDYNIFSNKIFIYDFEKDFDKTFDKIDSENKEIYFHELNHVLTDYTISSVADLLAKKIDNKDNHLLKTKLLKEFSEDVVLLGKNTFTETINELFTREYLGIYNENKIGLKTGRAYSKNMPYTYVLAELLEEETLREYKFNDNESIIIDGLLKIDNNFEKVYKLITSVNDIKSESIQNKDFSTSNDKYKNIYESLSYFYEKKYNRKIEKDLVIISYLYDTEALEKENKRILEDFLHLEETDEIIDIIPKGYVSEDYKKNNNAVIIEYKKDGKRQIIKINEANRYL